MKVNVNLDEIDQDTPASQFKDPGLKNNVSVENNFASKILDSVFFIPQVKNWAISSMDVLDIHRSNQLLFHSKLLSHLQKNKTFIRTVSLNSLRNSTNICASGKIPCISRNDCYY